MAFVDAKSKLSLSAQAIMIALILGVLRSFIRGQNKIFDDQMGDQR